jgi:hypothetical protein
MRTNDIYVTAFPKSGITYLGFLLVAARLRHNGMTLVPTMYNIDFLLIDTHKMQGVAPASIWRDGVGELYKTHNPFVSVPNVIYLLREPVATPRSYFHFRRQLGAKQTAKEFVTGPEGLAAWIQHLRSWLIDNRNPSQSIFVTEYEQLQADPGAELRGIGEQLGLSFTNETIDFATRMAGIERMRASEAAFTARNPVYAQFDLQFVRKDSSRSVADFTPELIELIRSQAQPVYGLARSRLGAGRDHSRAGSAA